VSRAALVAAWLLIASVAAADPAAVDLGEEQTVATVLVDWEPGAHAPDYAVEVSRDGVAWEVAREIRGSNGGRDSIFLGRVPARHVRLVFDASRGYALKHLEAVSAAIQPSPNDFFHALAHAAPRGAYPRHLLHEQPYWTAIGADGDDRQPLLSTDGLLEVGIRSFSIEPFLTIDDRLVPWSLAIAEPTLADGDLPIPSVTWHVEPLVMAMTAFVAGKPGEAILYARYRVENRGETPKSVALWLGLRPFQVNPSWQSLTGTGGVSPIHKLMRDGRVVRVNGATKIALLTDPEGFGAARFEQGSLAEFLDHGALPPEQEVFDALGFASGALRYRFDLGPGATAEASIAIPLHDATPFLAALPSSADAPAHVAAAHDATVEHWRERLASIDVRLPAEAGDVVQALRAAVAQILVARAGPVLRPGTRTYARAWIRDGVMMASALLQFGLADEARAFLRWYLPYQDADGRVPCCVDWRGGDWAVEHDAPGQLMYGAMSLVRYAGDVETLRLAWPHVVRAVDYVDRLRRTRLGAEYETPEKRHFKGLLPLSISHEGYSANPVHAYWDDFWALRGLDDAADAATLLGETAEAARIARIRDAFAADLAASIVATMQFHHLDTIPASADLGDFDPSAISIALAENVREVLPPGALARTYERYVEDFRKRRALEIAWEAYTPYELRNVEALVRLGRRDDALFLLGEMLADQRPPGWRQWGEIVWRDPTAPRFIGDVPHTWIASGYVRAVRAMLVYERDDGALVIGAGVPLAWIRGEGGVAANGLRTHRGPVSYRMKATGERSLAIEIDAGAEVPDAGIVVRPPVGIRAVRVDGKPAAEWRSDSVTLRALPARIEIEY